MEISERKPGLINDTYIIPGAPKNDFILYPVNDSYFYVYIDRDRGSLRVPAIASDIAKSIVNDYSNSQLAAGPEAKPGIFWLEGIVTKEQVLKLHKDKLDEALAFQKNWFIELVKMADNDFMRFRTHNAVGKLQRIAAEYLNLQRDWIMAPAEIDRACPACKQQYPFGAAVCPNCKCILDQALAAKLAFAK